MNHHFYADDSQIYLSFKPSAAGEPTTSKLRIESCIHDVNNWMSGNKLTLNHDKTELLVLHARHRSQPPLESILVCSDVIYSSNSAKDIGALFDTVMSMDNQINSICQSAFYHLRNIAQISQHISFRNCETLIHAFVTSKIDHYNVPLSGLKQDRVRKFQYVQNSAARLLTGTRKHEHITPVLRDLHWLPGHERIRFKILLMTFKCLNQLAPSYLSDLLIHYRPSRTLRLSDKELLVQLRCHLKTYGERAFSFIAPKLWNTLPLSIKRCNSAESFKSNLKTYLFRNCFELYEYH